MARRLLSFKSAYFFPSLNPPCSALSPPSSSCVLLTHRRSYQHHTRDAFDNGIAPLAFSRQNLLAWWHRSAREVSLSSLKWEGRDHLQSSCTVLRTDGSIESTSPLSKQDLITKYGVQPRDLRSLDAHILDVRPSLLVCKRSIILCTPIVRAIISHDRLLLIGTDPSNPLVTEAEANELAESVRKTMNFLEIVANADTSNMNGSKKNFEFRALEALLLLTVRGFKIVTTELQEKVYELVPQLRFGVSPAELRDLLQSKRVVEDCLFTGRALQSAVSAVLSEDEDLVGMYLTDKAAGTVRELQDHQTAELLLEYYERRLDETNESSVRLASLLADLDSNISLTLASTRVRLQNLELQTAISTMALAAGATLAGFFGMNLASGLEEHPSAFYVATGAGIASMGVIMVIGWVRLIRARRSLLLLGGSMRHRKQRDALINGGRPKKLAPWAKKEPATKEEKQVKQEEKKEEKKDGSEI